MAHYLHRGGDGAVYHEIDTRFCLQLVGEPHVGLGASEAMVGPPIQVLIEAILEHLTRLLLPKEFRVTTNQV